MARIRGSWRRQPLLAWSVAALLAVGLVSVSIVQFRYKPPRLAPLYLQAATPVENIVAMLDAVHEFNGVAHV